MSLSLRARLVEKLIPKLVPTADQSPAEQRAKVDRLPALANRRVEVSELQISGVPCLRVRPKGSMRRRHLLHLHGGGFVIGTPRGSLGYLSELALRCDAVVTSVDYRLAPEHPHPSAVDDSLAVHRVLLDEVEEGSLALIGESAGGNLVAATLVRARDEGLAMPACAVLVSPVVDLTFSSGSMQRNQGSDVMLGRDLIECWRAAYVGDRDPADAAISPLFADLSGLPPLHVQATTAEVLEDDARRFVERAREAGVDAELVVHDDLWHVFQTMAPLVPEAGEALEQINDFVRRHTRG